jgi:hypothetical protein
MITYPPELLPMPDPDDHAEVWVSGDNSGKPRLIASFPASPDEEPLGGMSEKPRRLLS